MFPIVLKVKGSVACSGTSRHHAYALAPGLSLVGERVVLRAVPVQQFTSETVQLAATTAHNTHRTATVGDMTARSDLLRDARFIAMPMKK